MQVTLFFEKLHHSREETRSHSSGSGSESCDLHSDLHADSLAGCALSDESENYSESDTELGWEDSRQA